MLKEILYSSIGTLSLTINKFKELIEDLIQNEQLTKEEGKRLVDEAIVGSQNRSVEVKAIFEGYVDQLKKNIQKPAMEKLNTIADKFAKQFKSIPFLESVLAK